MQEWLAYRARATPDRAALILGDRVLSFGALAARAGSLAASLLARGVGPGDRVAVLLPNGVRHVLLVHALTRAGAVLVPLNTRLAPTEIAWQVGDCRPALLVRDAAFAAAGAAVAAAHPGLPQWVPPGDDEALDGGWEGPPGGWDLRQPIEAPPEVEAGRLQAIIYTSGTTGRPKGVMLTYRNHWHSAVASSINLGHHLDDRWLLCLPLFHVGGLAILWRGLIGGTAVVLHRSFDPELVVADLAAHRVALVSLVSEMLQRVLTAFDGRPQPPSFRLVLLGGGPAPLPLLQACAERGLRVVQSYGLTETDSQVVALPPEEALGRLGTAGLALPGSVVRVVAADGRPLPAGAEGEILVRGPTVMRGYFERPEATAAALAGGWLHTGDVGSLDAAGYLRVLARRDDLIVRGGENVYPAEIESVLAAHPAVLESGVAAAPDPRWGQAPVAHVRLRAGSVATEAELVAFCRARLAGFKVPVRVVFRSGPMPRNAAGKLLRRELRTE